MRIIFFIPLFLIAFNSYAVDLKKGIYEVCTNPYEINNKLSLVFNFRTRHHLQIKLNGEIADGFMAKKILEPHLFRFSISNESNDQKYLDATLLEVKKCGPQMIPRKIVGNNFSEIK
jgi:hypothetical protein